MERDLDRIEEYVRGGIDRSTTRGLAIFSCSAQDFWKVVALPVPVHSRVVINEWPAVSQLESVAQGFDRFAVLLVDRQRARILVFHFGELVDHSELLDARPATRTPAGISTGAIWPVGPMRRPPPTCVGRPRPPSPCSRTTPSST